MLCGASALAYLSLATSAMSDSSASSRLATEDAAADWRGKVDPVVLAAATAGHAEFLIYMKQQADLSASKSLATKEEKGQHVYHQLTTTAQSTQANVKQALTQLGVQHRTFWISNTIYAQGNAAVVQTIASLPEVRAIYQVAKGAVTLPPQENATASPNQTQTPAAPNLIAAAEPGLEIAKAPDAWALGVKGQGVIIAGADTGVRFTHEALRNQYRGWGGSAAASVHDYNWHDAIHVPNWPPEPANACNPGGPLGAGEASPEPCDDDQLLGGGHGSHTMGTMAGNDGAANDIGMAPEAKWMACRNMSNGVGNILTYLECMEFFLAPTKIDGSDPDPTKAPHVVNNSWGCLEGCPPDPNPLRDTLKASRAAGIVYVASAGNDGPDCYTIFHPLARYPEAFTVGSTTHTEDKASGFSSRGPAALDPENPDEPFYLKPNIAAPGSAIRSALRGSDTEYGVLSGTSMAGPHVAGLVALVISANPALAGNVDRIEEIIEKSAEKKTTEEACGGDTDTQVPNNTYGWGRIDALAAVEMAQDDLPNPVPAQLLNISTRARVQTDDKVLIGGFIVTGDDPKEVILRAIGPSMRINGQPVAGRMADPTLELRDENGVVITSNDNWKQSPQRAQIQASGIAPKNDKESAIVRTLAPGSYTVVLRGKNNSTGIAVVEAYDRGLSVQSVMANISSRSFVDTGDNVMIGGFIAGNHPGSTKVLVRAIGPSLEGEVPDPLNDPTLELYDANGEKIGGNDNWKNSADRAEITATGIAPSHDRESAIIRTLVPAPYTAIVRGKNNTAGVGVVEIYNIRE